MKGLKYRAWDEGKKKYVGSFLIDMFGNTYEVSIAESEAKGCCAIVGNPNLVIEQYTGLKDKNGKDIYEGDVVRIGLYLFDKVVGVVEQHKDGGWLVIDRSDKVDIPYSLYHHPESVVIGNIHESNIEELRRKNERRRF